VTIVSRPTPPPWVIAVAASAGGIQALETLFSGLPGNLSAAILVVQHLFARPGGSQIHEILRRHSHIPIAMARQGEQIVTGHAYIAEPGLHMMLDNTLNLRLTSTARVHFVRPSADVLFASVARNVGRCAIAVVLTGTGSDGAEGALAIHNAGGVVIAQDEATSQHFGMPGAAIRIAHADHVLPLQRIASQLIGLTTQHVDH
jgi:two-component system, chemotaxis family, protein-glutamate methylesterase/glutaminase